MTETDDKRKQVAQLYASMSEEELKLLADEAWTLTETGKELLSDELARRDLNYQLTTVAKPDEILGNYVMIRKFRDLPEALLAKGFLESAGIESILVDETTIRMDWLWSNLLGGIKLCVNPEDAATALQMLNQEIPEEFNVEGIGDFQQPTCPQCQSLNISYEDLDKPVAYAGILFLGLPISVTRKRWKCSSCGHIWEPVGDTTDQTG
jgi:hypothetical protein